MSTTDIKSVLKSTAFIASMPFRLIGAVMKSEVLSVLIGGVICIWAMFYVFDRMTITKPDRELAAAIQAIKAGKRLDPTAGCFTGNNNLYGLYYVSCDQSKNAVWLATKDNGACRGAVEYADDNELEYKIFADKPGAPVEIEECTHEYQRVMISI